MSFHSFTRSSLVEKKESNTKIILPIPVYHKMLAYTQASPGEISGFGRTRTTKKGKKTIVTITDVRIFTQTIGSAETNLDKKSLAKFIVELSKVGERPQRWNLWWHSHNDFQVFFSGVDTGTISELTSKKKEDAFLYSVCINKHGDLVGRVDAKDKELGEAEVVVDKFLNPKLVAACEKEVKEKVTFVKPTVVTVPRHDEHDPYGTIENSPASFYSPAFTRTLDRTPWPR